MMYTLTSRGILWAIGFQLKVGWWSLGVSQAVSQVIGEQAPRQEAPVVIAAPHTSFIDVYVISICRGSPVARSENRRWVMVWWLGVLEVIWVFMLMRVIPVI